MTQGTTPLTVAELWIYPVKSLGGIPCKEAHVTARGFQYDRHWMLITDDGTFVTQRQIPKMAAISVELNDSALRFHAKGHDTFSLSLHTLSSDSPIDVVIHGAPAKGIKESKKISDWLTQVLGTYKGSPLSLVRFPDKHLRPVDPDENSTPIAYTEFADQYPFLVTWTASLEKLNQELQKRGKESVPMSRFRPNIVLEGCPAFEEDHFEALAFDTGASLHIAKPCARCPVTTVDQTSGIKPDKKEPLATLSTFRRQNGKVLFGQNAITTTGDATIRIGEGVQASYRRDGT